jgi:hypothetical protein
MGLKRGPKIVTDGLVLYFDAAFENSFIRDTLPITNGLVMWLDAADNNSFTYSSGTTVSQWNDKSGSGYHMTPVTNGPTRSTTRNSKSVVAFTTTQNLRNTSIDLRTSAYTVFLVGRYSSSTPAERILTGIYNNWLLGTWQGWVNQYYAEGWVQYAGYGADTTWRTYMGDWSGSGTDQANFYSSGASIVANSTAANAGPWGLGMNSSEPSNSEIAEVLVYNKVLSTTERRLIHTYLTNKWALTSNGEGIIYDVSGNNNTGIFSNGYSFNSSNSGSIVFDGTNDYLITTLNQTPSLNITSQITLETWIKSTALSNALHGDGLFSKGNSSDGNSGVYELLLVPSGSINLPYFRMRIGSSTPVYNPSNITMSVNSIYHVVATYNGSIMRMFVNGVESGSGNSVSGSIESNTQRLAIGVRHIQIDYGVSFFPGHIYISKIYNRALSASEILQNFNAIKPRFNL